MSTDQDASHTSKKSNGFAFDSLESVRKKLLDLSGRNALLNYKHPKASCIRLIDELPDQLVEQLQKGNELTFIPVPEPTEKQLIKAGYITVNTETREMVVNGHPTAEQWAKYIGFETTYDLPEKSVAAQGFDYHQDSDMQTLMYAPELEARLRNLRSKAETAIEEGGANILYLGVGFLEWIESRDSEIKRLSPLFTVPVKLDRATHAGQDGAYRYRITMKDDGLITNITLREKLANDFGLVLPSIDDDTTPEGYFSTVEQTILQLKPQWRIRRQASLVLLNFTKQAMYQDLDPNNWPDGVSIEDHPLIQKFFSAAMDGEEGGSTSYENEHPIDNVEDIHDQFPIVFDADSSQHSALIDAVNGENLVIEGPPGSGKSQTIANLIAACIGSGKSVLFVAEKMAALNVVKDRLDKAGLGDFCLELHSHKTNKQKILSDLDKRLQKQYREPDSINADIARFEDLKNKLAEYVELINSEWGNTGLTLHDIFNKATRYREQLAIDPATLKIEGIDGKNLTLVRQKELFDQADMLAHIYGLVSSQASGANISNHYWYGVNNTELMGYQGDKLSEALRVWTTHLQNLGEHWLSLNSSLELGVSSDSPLTVIESLVASIEQLPALIGGELFEHFDDLIDQVDAFEQWLQDYEEIHQCHDKLTPIVTPSVIGDLDALVKMKKALAIFQKLGLAQSNTLEEITELHAKIQTTIAQVDEIDQQFVRIKPNLPSLMGNLFVSSRSGLEEVSTLIALITALPQELWRYRDDIYDNPDLDPLLEVMTEKLRDLTPLHQALHEQFSLHRLPDAETLKQHRLTIEGGGFFKWFSSDWRQSRKAILALAAAPKSNAASLFSALSDLVRYASGIEAMDRLNSEDGALQDMYKGVDTPMERAIGLRHWYKAVRAEYGLGFGDRVALGNALLSLDRALAMGIKDYANQGMGSQIKTVLSASSSINNAVNTYPALADTSATLQSPLTKVGEAIKVHLTVLQSAIIGTDHQLGGLGDIFALMEQQHRRVNTWRSNTLAELLLQAMPLSPKANEFSSTHLASGRNSVQILKVLSESPLLLNSLQAKPEAERYHLIQSSLEALQQDLALCNSAGQLFIELGKVNLEEWMENSCGAVKALIVRNNTALENPNWLNTWLDYTRLRLKLSSQGLDKIVAELERSQIETVDLNAIVQLVMSHQLANEILVRHSDLALFSGMEQMANRKKFQEYDRKIMRLQRQLVAFKASRTKPPVGVSQGKIRDYSELSLIRHNLNLKRPKVAMRSLIKRSGRAMQALKPCFMMSPMSVAQYLEPGQFTFDLVVMDEASQIRPEDALGAIARADSLVVVGDPKQLPPTNFFQKVSSNQDNDDDSVALEESESILESVIPMFKNRRLRWHYRSRHESLIAFSNQRFYDSNLILFPSPMKESDEFGIRYNRVHRGRCIESRNVEEAREIVRSVAEHMIKNQDESVGVVAMNAKQSDEIERQFEQLVKDDPVLQKAYEKNQQLDEPLFVKNLESVQGDERDVIIISMTYGPDTVGATSMHQRYGPIAYGAGWRRLNVLFTRSKKRMHIFSSMDSGHIRNNENSKRGVVALKAFLAYCETGSLQHHEHTGKAADSDFEIAVMNALSDHGYQCEPQLGVTGYFLDLAVKDPGQPGRFLMGIECDGASYHSAKSTRDRDRLRQDILENLGWEIHRIWSTDWFKNPQAQLVPILRRLGKLRTPISDYVEPVVAEKLLGEPIEDINTAATMPNGVEAPEPFTADQESAELGLRSRLQDYDGRVIRPGSPSTSDDQRLLRPSMLDALLDSQPCSKAEFLEMIPQYLRNGTNPEEGQYLDKVLEIITDYG